MKTNKMLFISVLLVLILLCAISTASADDSLNQNLTISQDEGGAIDVPLESSDSGEVLSGSETTYYVDSYVDSDGDGSETSPFKTISSAVAKVNSGDGGETIFIKNGEYSESSAISISKSISIIGESKNGVVITSTGSNGVFTNPTQNIDLSILLNNLTIKDITCTGSNAPVRFYYANIDLKILNCTFDNCKSKVGAIQVGTTKATIEDCEILNSECNNGGGSSASAILFSNGGNYVLKNIIISGAKSNVNCYGVLYFSATSGTLDINNLSLINSEGKVQSVIRGGGSTSSGNTISIKNSKIQNNNVTNFNDNNKNSFINVANNGKLTIEQSTISDNICVDEFIRNLGEKSETTLKNNNINNIQSSSTTNAGTGSYNLDANYWGEEGVPSDITVNNYIILNDDGTLKLSDSDETLDIIITGLNDEEKEVEITYDYYVDAFASDGGDGSKTNPFNSISAAVSVANSGETIFIRNGEYVEPRMTLSKGISFIGESREGVIIKSSANNGLFYTTSFEGKISFENLNIKDVRAGSFAPIQIGGSGDLDIKNCTFDNCGGKYGSIYAYLSGTTVIEDCKILNSKATASGGTGAIYFAGSSSKTFTIKNTSIKNTTVTTGYMNGVIYSYNTNLNINIENLIISDSKGPSNGIINTRSNMAIDNSEFYNNSISKFNGNYGLGLFYIYGSKTLSIESSIIKDNQGSDYITYSQSIESKFNLNYDYVENNTPSISFVNQGNNNFEYNYWGSNDAPADPAVTRYAVKVSDNKFQDDLGNDLLKEIPVPSEENTDEHNVLKEIYVSKNGNDDNEGSISNPVATISKAIELTQTGKIIILAGEYTLNEVLSISKDIDISGRGNVIIKSNSQIITSSANLNLTNIKFNSTADVSGTITSTTADLNIDSCIFYSNTASGSAIYVDGGNVNIVNSVLLNPTGYALTVSSATSSVNANNNWWGKNDGANTEAAVTSWIVMDAGIDLARINSGDEVTINVSFNKTSDGSDYTETLPEFNVTVSANNLNTVLQVKNNKATTKYTVNEDDEAVVTSGSESVKVSLKLYDAPEIIYVDGENGLDTNDGNISNPVKSIEKAIELAQKGKIVILEGTYTIENTLGITKDLSITGEGKVIIDGNSKRILSNSAELTITNVEFTNGYSTSSVFLNNGNLTLNNCLIHNNILSTPSNAAIIANNKKLTINSSELYNNAAIYGIIYNNGGDILINNSKFYENDESIVTGTTLPCAPLIYTTKGNAVIENTNFTDNVGKNGIVIAQNENSLSKLPTNNLTINNCIFRNNEASFYGALSSILSNTTVKSSIFINNKVNKNSNNYGGLGGAVYVSGDKTEIENSVFINNIAQDKGQDIYVYNGELDISDSVLINENGYSIEKADAGTVVCNDNWWGANTPNTQVDVERWIVMTVTSDDSNIEVGDEITITASFDKNNNGETYFGNLPEVFNVTFTSTGGLNEIKSVADKKASVTYTVSDADKTITVKSDNATETLKVNRVLNVIYVNATGGSDDNDGDIDSPVKTIAKALELVENDKEIIILEGTYVTGDLGILSKNITITGSGKVTIDANNNNRIIYVGNYSNLVLKNLILTNGYASSNSDESGALIGNNGNLTVINCTLTDSKSEKNGGAIFNARNLVVINSTFENNIAEKNGGAIFTQNSGAGVPTVSIVNSTFRKNSANGYTLYGGGAVYIQQAADGVLIKNSVFEENTCIDCGGGAIEIALVNVATIDNCTFISNSANSEDHKSRSNYGGGAVSFKGQYDSTRETLTITNSVFIDNSVSECGGGAVFVMYASLDIHNSVLIENDDSNGISVYGRDADIAPAKITANDNWWGSNDNPKSSINRGTLTRWAILTISNDSEIKTGETVKLTASINYYTTGNENGTLSAPITVSRPVTIYTNLGNIEATLVNGEFTTYYEVPEGLKIISAIVDSENQVLYVLTTKTTVDIDDITGLMGDRNEYTIKVTTNDGSVINTGNVELYFSETLVKTIPVLNGEAKDTVIINKETGIYTITAKYVDETREFESNQGTATLNVTGIDNIVTPETLNKFFEDGLLLSDLPFDEIIFEGNFENLGLLLVDKKIKLTGRNAKFTNTAFDLYAEGIELSNMDIVVDDNIGVDGSVIYIGNDNIIVSNNNITYNAPDDVQSYAIEVDVASGVKIINNNIKYSVKQSQGEYKTIAINAAKSNGLIFENNNLEANIPSVPISYINWPKTEYLSQAIHIEESNDVSIKNNNITVNYTSFTGSDDTIYAVHVTSSDNALVSNNNIKLNAHECAYGLVMDGQNLNISKNTIDVSSEDYYASGININSNSTALIDSNNISATSKQVSYPIYLDDWQIDASDITVSNNNIKGDSNTVYGIYVEANKTNISGNTIEVNGNYTMGIAAHETDLIIENNNINSNGSNTGTALRPQSSVPVETTGIAVSGGNAEIKNNNITSTGNSTIDAIKTNATIKDNKLTSSSGIGDDTIKSNSSTLTVDNNKTSQDPQTQPQVQTPVVSLTGKNVNMYYSASTKYQVLVSADGKALSGVTVKFTLNGKVSYVKTNAQGYAVLTIKDNKLTPKKYTITAEYEGKVIKNTLTVKQILKSKNYKVKKSARKLVLKATLKQGKKAIKGKKITFKFKGKTYKAKTNKKGVAKVTIKKNVIKKLKKGKKYTFKVTYLKNTIKKTVRVK